MATVTETQFGVRYINGVEDWKTHTWWGTIHLPELRASFQEQYDLRMASMGIPSMKCTFLTRTVTTSVSDVEIIVDPEPEEPTPEEPVDP